ncbi:hypothetical protein B0A48_12759 [Cryoendolithus antarcticus]|uniref:Nucleoporin Nup159/Nup146 N-terminal domain-containing protein n=1 Tax=Cryoendolithus antarcticus TaxID=1507870 RepID=A0A1V8SS53_9PEZI|nr:hypothetical protein B0A48_12759 [Cryoendolithus antarcticus]
MEQWGFGGGAPAASTSGPQTTIGADLEAIDVEQVGFKPIAGNSKVRLLPTPWSRGQYPSATASLLSIASGRGLLAAAGPDGLVLAGTQRVREAFTGGAESQQGGIAAGSGVRDFAPDATLSIPRVSHVAFSSDESCLVVCAEQGGGLAVYDVDAALGGGKEPAFQMPTDGTAIRHLLPNPAKENSHQFAIVLADGKLLLADLKQRQLVSSAAGSPVFSENVSCACWSKLGKQIVAGYSDGHAAQIDLQGTVKAEIPQPPDLAQTKDESTLSLPLTAIYWLENLEFLMIHSPINPPPEQLVGMAPPNDSIYHLVRKEKGLPSYTYHKFALDPCAGFLDDRLPAHHLMQRLRDWPPDLDDTLVLTSTLSTDIGLITKSKVSFHQPDRSAGANGEVEVIGDIPAEQIVNTYTTTVPKDDVSRANLPTSAFGDATDTSVIGMALDLSAKQKLANPIPSDSEIEESATPLPAVCVLNHEGILCTWWIVYQQSIRTKTAFPGLTAVSGQPQTQSSQSRPQLSSGFGGGSAAAAFGSPAPVAAPIQTPPQPAFGQSSTPGFGGAGMLGAKQSPWGAPPASPASKTTALGQPSGGAAFGTPSAFGATGGMGPKTSVWGTPSQTPAASKPPVPAFGQASAFGSNAATPSPFSSFASADKKPAASPFASFATGGSKLSSFGGQTSPSPFGSATPSKQPGMPVDPSFGSTVTLNSSADSFGSGNTFGQASGFSFGKPSQEKEESMGDSEATTKPTDENAKPAPFGGFKLGSMFAGDGSAKDDLPKPEDAGAGMFGAGFGSALGDAEKIKAAEAPKTTFGAPSNALSSTGGLFGKKHAPVTPVKPEPGTEEPKLKDIPAFSTTPASPPKQKQPAPAEAPMPPDFLSSSNPAKVAKPATEPEDAPLPPDFTSPAGKSDQSDDAPIAGSPPLDVGNEQFSSPATSREGDGPPEGDEDEADWDDEDERDDEEERGEREVDDGSDEGEEEDDDDDAEEEEEEDEEDQTQDSHAVSDPAGLLAFEARLAPASPKRQQPQQDSYTPETTKKPSYTPAGLPPNLNFPPPNRAHKSPSPVRKPQPQAQPPRPSPALNNPSFGRISVPPSRPVERPSSRQKAPTSQSPPEPVDLEDEADARIQELLNAPMEPSSEIPDFIAYREYATTGDEKPGIAGQMEKVYRDVNSMIDTLGLNARSLQSFVAAHSHPRPGSRSREDLDDEDSWLFSETTQLHDLIASLDAELEDNKLEDVSGKISELQDSVSELHGLRSKTSHFRTQLSSLSSPAQQAAQHNAPLPPELRVQQSALRSSIQRAQTLLSRAEEALSLLRADLAAVPAQAGKGGVSKTPTVEAVERTVLKMTAMIEQRSGDIDVLESRIRRLPGGVSALKLDDGYEDDLASALGGTKLGASTYSTPPLRRSQPPGAERLGMSGAFGGSRYLRESINGRSSVNGSARKKMADVNDAEIGAWRAKDARRRRVLEGLKEKVEGRGVRSIKAGK